MFSCLQILEAFLWFVLITLLNVTLIIFTLSVSRLLNLLLRLVAFLLFLNPQCLASISRWITASSSWKRFCLLRCSTSIDIMGLQSAYANLHTDQERDYFMQRYHDVISSFGGKTSYDADNRPLLVMRSNLWASGYDVD